MVVVIVMGVCGSGKTTIGTLLSTQLQWSFEDADRWHSPENIDKMSQNIPLTDEDRQPWLESLHGIIQRYISEGKSGVIACSALKKQYRDILVGEAGYIPKGHCVLVVLHGSMDTIAERMKGRDHFMPVGLLESQFGALELPLPAETNIMCDVRLSPDDAVCYIVQRLKI